MRHIVTRLANEHVILLTGSFSVDWDQGFAQGYLMTRSNSCHLIVKWSGNSKLIDVHCDGCKHRRVSSALCCTLSSSRLYRRISLYYYSFLFGH